jgi:prevent-host-death family protein
MRSIESEKFEKHAESRPSTAWITTCPTASRSTQQLDRLRGTLLGAYNRSGTMLDITKDIQSLTTFRRRSGDLMKQLKRSKRPIVLTVNGKAEAVVQDAAAYQRLLDLAARADVHEAIRQGLEDIAHGRTRPAQEVFDEIRRLHGIPR